MSTEQQVIDDFYSAFKPDNHGNIDEDTIKAFSKYFKDENYEEALRFINKQTDDYTYEGISKTNFIFAMNSVMNYKKIHPTGGRRKSRRHRKTKVSQKSKKARRTRKSRK